MEMYIYLAGIPVFLVWCWWMTQRFNAGKRTWQMPTPFAFAIITSLIWPVSIWSLVIADLIVRAPNPNRRYPIRRWWEKQRVYKENK